MRVRARAGRQARRISSSARALPLSVARLGSEALMLRMLSSRRLSFSLQ